MMGKALAVFTSTLPLLNWPEQARINTMELERENLHQRIEALPHKAHRRIVLEARLQDLTARQLQMEADITSPRMARLQS